MGLLKTGEMKAKKDKLENKKTTMRQEIRSNKKNDRAVVGSNEPLIITQQSVAIPGFSQSEDTPLAVAFENIRKRKKQQREDRNTKKRLTHINEGDELIKEAWRSTPETRMFDSFETVNLGRDDSGNVTAEGPVVVPSQPSQKEKEVLQAESEQHEKTNDAEVEGEDAAVEGGNAAVEVPPNMENVVQEELQPEPLVVIMPIKLEQPSKSRDAEVEVPPPIVENVVHEEIQPEPLVVIMPLQPKQQSGGTTEVEPDPINTQIPVEPELTLRPWLQPEAETSAVKGPIESTYEIITHVLLSMNQEGPSTQDGNQIQQTTDEDQCKTPETAPVTLKERCFIWATMENDNKYETIFQLRGPNTIEAMRYNFMTMAPQTCIDMQMVSLVCHALNREELQRFQRDVYCVPPEILIRIFQTYGTNYLDKKTKMPYLVSQLKDQHYLELLDKEKLRKHSTCNIMNQLRVWAGAPPLLKKQTIALQLRFVDVLKQPNPTNCGVYVMKWMELIDVAVLSAAHTFKLRYNIEEWSQEGDCVKADYEQGQYTTCGRNQTSNQYDTGDNHRSKGKMGRKPKPSAALKSPFVQVSTAELEKKH
ncbi:hypothetical protein PIB30_097341 [Stylosanthes scabra]|uniref:Ubiquitin-like protease family profile domain-containing protein n=1 Tax=Stylosanthes scabra TaxID=79078 RepID=A0ABU6UVT7_9FABA|nr:hypothetical protein [Stylosanthes scabra]